MNTQAEKITLAHMRDVSEWQGEIDWHEYASHDATIVATYIRAGRGPAIVDERARANFAGAKRSRTHVGGYWYLVPGIGSPELQIGKLIEWSPRRGGANLRPAIDCEQGQPSRARQYIVDSILYARRRLGYWPTIYGPSSYLHDLHLPAAFAGCPLWIAELGVDVPAVPAPWTHWSAWQHSWTSHAPGIAGNVDDSYVAELRRLLIPTRVQLARGVR